MNKKVIIFDLDGTLINTLKDLKSSVNHAFSLYNLPKVSAQKVKKVLGNGAAKTVRMLMPKNYTEEEYNNVLCAFKEHYANHYLKHTSVYRGIKKLLINLRTDGYRIAVATNKTNSIANSILKELLGNLFDCVQGMEEGLNPKPHPDIINKICSNLGVSKNECLYVGDCEVDEKTSISSQLDNILVTYGFRSEDFLIENTVSMKVNNTKQLYKGIKNWN